MMLALAVALQPKELAMDLRFRSGDVCHVSQDYLYLLPHGLVAIVLLERGDSRSLFVLHLGRCQMLDNKDNPGFLAPVTA
jgi:hypothetical protein